MDAIKRKPGSPLKKLFFGTVMVIFCTEVFLQIVSMLFAGEVRGETVSLAGELRILCVGDSYTYGIGAPYGESYPDQLEKILSKDFSVDVVNLGNPGCNSSMVVADFKENLDTYRPQIVFALIGVNDSWNFRAVDESAAEFAESRGLGSGTLDRILGWSKVYKLARVLASPPSDFDLQGGEAKNDSLGETPWNDDWTSVATYREDLRDEIGGLLAKLWEHGEHRDSDEYLTVAKQLAETAPDRPGLWIHLGESYALRGEYDLAFEAFETARKLAPENLRMHEQRAITASFLGKWDEVRKSIAFVFSKPEVSELHRAILQMARRPEVGMEDEAREFGKLIEGKLPGSIVTSLMGTNDYSAVLEYNLIALDRLASEREARLILLTYPADDGDEVHIEEVASRRRIPFVRLSAPFEDRDLLESAKTKDYFIPDGHPNAAGYKIIAELLADKVREMVKD
ncbi:MAG: GDSL-type esterase/lipase family protein [Planctomycetes bacterium]|nr:GDSL-type esterase/lipase family protein [Planctomycetota bacterium]